MKLIGEFDTDNNGDVDKTNFNNIAKSIIQNNMVSSW